MSMKIKNLLKEEIAAEFEALDEIEFGGEQHKLAVDSVSKLLDKLTDMERMELEFQDKAAARDEENDIKLQAMKDEKRDRIIKNSLTLLSVGGSIVLAIWGTNKSIKFEETGTITTIMGRGWIQKLLPKK